MYRMGQTERCNESTVNTPLFSVRYMCQSDMAAFANMEYFSKRTFQGGMSDLAELRQFFLTEEENSSYQPDNLPIHSHFSWCIAQSVGTNTHIG